MHPLQAHGATQGRALLHPRAPQRQRITAEIQARNDDQLLLFISFIYYGFNRSGSELRLLRVKDLRERTVLVPAARAKNSKAEHVAIVRQLAALIEKAGASAPTRLSTTASPRSSSRDSRRWTKTGLPSIIARH